MIAHKKYYIDVFSSFPPLACCFPSAAHSAQDALSDFEKDVGVMPIAKRPCLPQKLPPNELGWIKSPFVGVLFVDPQDDWEDDRLGIKPFKSCQVLLLNYVTWSNQNFAAPLHHQRSPKTFFVDVGLSVRPRGLRPAIWGLLRRSMDLQRAMLAFTTTGRNCCQGGKGDGCLTALRGVTAIVLLVVLLHLLRSDHQCEYQCVYGLLWFFLELLFRSFLLHLSKI